MPANKTKVKKETQQIGEDQEILVIPKADVTSSTASESKGSIGKFLPDSTRIAGPLADSSADHPAELARKSVRRYDAYNLFRCFPRIRGAGYNEEFHDAETGDSPLSRGVFEWLVNIRPSHLLFRSGDTCYLEPYIPSRFARQFGYDQLYVGNPNPDLHFMGSLIDGARAWRFFTADDQMIRQWTFIDSKSKGTLILHQNCVSYNTFSYPIGSFEAYKRFYLLPSQINGTGKAFLLHKAVTSSATRTRSFFLHKMADLARPFVEAWQ